MIRRNISLRRFIQFGVYLAVILSGVYLQADVPKDRKPTEFYFARLRYPGYHDDSYLKNYYTDWPNMDDHLVSILNRVSNIHADAVVVPVTSELFKFPFMYTVEPEQINFDDRQVQLIREWSARGGRLWMDDFHGDEDRIPTFELLKRIFPDAQFVELGLDDPLFHVFYDIREIIQVTNDSIAGCRNDGCEQWENGPTGKIPAVYAVYSSLGGWNTAVALLTYNEDIGDGLEWADSPDYPQEYSLFAFKITTNILTWFLTHD